MDVPTVVIHSDELRLPNTLDNTNLLNEILTKLNKFDSRLDVIEDKVKASPSKELMALQEEPEDKIVNDLADDKNIPGTSHAKVNVHTTVSTADLASVLDEFGSSRIEANEKPMCPGCLMTFFGKNELKRHLVGNGKDRKSCNKFMTWLGSSSSLNVSTSSMARAVRVILLLTQRYFSNSVTRKSKANRRVRLQLFLLRKQTTCLIVVTKEWWT